MKRFNYSQMVSRNLGFVSNIEQQKIREANLLIIGVGGMGGAAALTLARAGVGTMRIADIDHFEMSNLNRQVFCDLSTIDMRKVEATVQRIKDINPEIDIESFDESWTMQIEHLASSATIIINGTDDLAASTLIYRTARKFNKTVIDAYASPLPSVYVTRPSEAMPEERLNYPTLGRQWNDLSDDIRQQAFLKEAEYVLMNSSSRHYVDLTLAGEVAAGKRGRMSFAPMVISTGTFMAYEAINWITKGATQTDCQGWFFNPYRATIEKPLPKLAQTVLRPFVRKRLEKLIG